MFYYIIVTTCDDKCCRASEAHPPSLVKTGVTLYYLYRN
eukprot:COSAG01_NODE_54_length_31327_cov_317.045356_18_plen_39_part_00